MSLDVGPVTPYRTLAARLRDWAAALFTSFGSSLATAADAAAARTLLGLGTAALKNTGTSGDAVPLLNVGGQFSAPVSMANTGSFAAPLALYSVNGTALGGVLLLQQVSASPAANDRPFFLLVRGNNSTGGVATYVQQQFWIIDATAGSEDSRMTVNTLVGGADTPQLGIQNGLLLGAATGSYQGTGTLNATGVYDDGALLSCYPFDAALDGRVDVEKWDARVPDRHWPAQHETVPVAAKDGGAPSFKQREVAPARVEARPHTGARKFAARLGGEFDPLDIDKYAAHWRQKRHLTSLPNEANYDPAKPLSTGEWIQRLVETVEIQAVHIAKLNDRLKVLEAK